jgi:6-pyruvoyltetrahydropterin/6-carboxytetrahydropterin synthase
VLFSPMKVTVCRKEHFNAAHRLHNPAWSDERNREVFRIVQQCKFSWTQLRADCENIRRARCNTGYVMDMKVLSDLLKKMFLKRFDHKNLNLDTEEFKNLIPQQKTSRW